MKRLFLILVIVLPLFASCKGKSVKDIKVTSVELVSLTPQGLRDIDAVIKLGLYNPTVGFEITDLCGTLKYKGQEAMILKADQLMVGGKSDKVYTIPVHGSLSEDFNPLQLLQMLKDKIDFKDVTLDVSVRPALRGGLGKNLEYKDIPLDKLLGAK